MCSCYFSKKIISSFDLTLDIYLPNMKKHYLFIKKKSLMSSRFYFSLIVTLNYHIYKVMYLLRILFFLLFASFFNPSSPVFEHLEDSSFRILCAVYACWVINKENKILGQAVKKIVLCGCAQHYYCTKFIVLIPDPTPITSPDPCPTWDWVDELQGLYMRMILWPQLQSDG